MPLLFIRRIEFRFALLYEPDFVLKICLSFVLQCQQADVNFKNFISIVQNHCVLSSFFYEHIITFGIHFRLVLILEVSIVLNTP